MSIKHLNILAAAAALCAFASPAWAQMTARDPAQPQPRQAQPADPAREQEQQAKEQWLNQLQECSRQRVQWEADKQSGRPHADVQPDCSNLANAAPGSASAQNGQAGGTPGQPGALPATPPPLSLQPGEGVPRADFARVFNSINPLSAQQIRQVHETYADLERANTLPAPQMQNRSLRASIAPGAQMPVIHLTAGYLTSLVFTDSAGEPWPILQVRSGSEGFQVEEGVEGVRTNIAAISVAQGRRHASTNLLVFLEGAAAPLPLMLQTDEKQADSRVDIQVTGSSPAAQDLAALAQVSGSDALALNDSPLLAQVLQGITPQGLRPVAARGAMSGHVQAWATRDGSQIYLRTSMQIHSPAPLRAGRSVDGSNAYLIPRAEVVSFHDRGNVYDIYLSGLQAPLQAPGIRKASAAMQNAVPAAMQGLSRQAPSSSSVVRSF